MATHENHDNVVIFTTLPNAAIASQIGEEAFRARINASREAALADLAAGFSLVVLVEPQMQSYFTDLTGDYHAVDDPGSTSTTMGHGRRLALQKAVEVGKDNFLTRDFLPILMWREPEKNLARFVPSLIRPIRENDADIVIPRRKSLNSYPAFSQDWETVGSLMSSVIIGGEPQDYWIGPRVFNLKSAHYFLDYPGDQTDLPDWHDCIFGPLVDAARDGRKITGVDIDFEYPPEQRAAEEDDVATMKKRMSVMRKLIKAMQDRKAWHLRKTAVGY